MKIITKDELKKRIFESYVLQLDDNIKKAQIQNNLNIFIEELYDISNLVVIPLTERETYIYRKKYGILDNGVCKTYKNLSKELGISIARVEQIVVQIEEKIYKYRVNKQNLNSYTSKKISSIDIIENDYLKNISIGELNLGSLFNRTVYNKNIYTLSDLLTFGYKELETILTSKQLNTLTNLLKELNIKYIEELTIEEKRKIISKTEIKKVMNSSICWIDMNYYIFNEISKSNKTLLDICNLIKKDGLNGVTVPIQIIKSARNIGFNVDKKSNNLNYQTINKLLDKKIKTLPLPSKVIRLLLKRKIITLKDLINHKSYDIKKSIYLDDITFIELLNIVHGYGLWFKDEIEKMKFYSFSIYEDLESDNVNSILENIKLKNLLKTYKVLLEQKKNIKNESSKLDIKINNIEEEIKKIKKI